MDQDAGVRHVRLTTGVSLAYTSTGPSSATPVLFHHAWAESRRSFDRLLALLPATVHAIAMDQRGHGDAERPAAGYSLDNLAEDVEAFMHELDLSSAVLFGSSSGGYVAQQVAIRNPELVAGLVLVGSPRSLQGRPAFADEVEQLTDPIDVAWVRESLTWFPGSSRCRRGMSTTASETVPASPLTCGAKHSAASRLRALLPTRGPSRHPPSSCGVTMTSC